jgi:hypothetical protein
VLVDAAPGSRGDLFTSALIRAKKPFADPSRG